jgi:hypothetical protein
LVEGQSRAADLVDLVDVRTLGELSLHLGEPARFGAASFSMPARSMQNMQPNERFSFWVAKRHVWSSSNNRSSFILFPYEPFPLRAIARIRS